jgi:hypothetical protein
MRTYSLVVSLLVVISACTQSQAPGVSYQFDTADVRNSDTGFPPSDVGIDTLPGTDTADPSVFVPVPCTENNDCNSGWCVETANGKMCTTTCIDTCPKDWFCGQVTNTGTDVTYICLPRFVTLCSPCQSNAECAAAMGSTGARCLSYGDSGSFCGAECGDMGGCPDGYECVTDEDGNESAQCVRTDKVCECSWKAIKDGANTTCWATNELGSCDGARSCLNGKLSTCDAPEAVAEACDGSDNNCNGETDEGTGDAPCAKSNNFGECQGVEECTGGTLVCSAALPELEACDGTDNNCDGLTDEGFQDTDQDGVADCMSDDDDGDGVLDGKDNCPLDANSGQEDMDGDTLGDVCDPDMDGDGDPNLTDCAPTDSAIGSKNVELCNGIDDNCNTVFDEGFADLDGDSLADCVDDDDDGDGVDDTTDNCPVTANADQTDSDKDGVGNACEDDSDGDGDPDLTDCAPLNPAIFHGAKELCNGSDENCNGIVDEGYPDIDADGVANCIDLDDDGDGTPDAADNCPTDKNTDQADFDKDGQGNVCDTDDDNDGDSDALDCAPLNAKVNHSATEKCNSIDDDCNGITDDENAVGCTGFYFNEDSDGYGMALVSKCLCGPAPPYSATQPGDCNDTNSAIFPGANEVCNLKDDNCNDQVDEGAAVGCKDAWVDGDGDNFGTGNATCVCPGTPGYAPQGGDCKDGDFNINPSVMETCDTKDNNCNGLSDEENANGCKTYYQDEDNDGYGKFTAQSCLCGPSGTFSALQGGDCDDDDNERYPGNIETCDGKDNNCNGQLDEGVLKTWYVDEDKDSWGATYNQQEKCTKPVGFVAKAGDCNDFNAKINPSQGEACNDIDDDCDGQIDNGLQKKTSYKDNDGDGYASKNATSLVKCNVPVGWALPQDPDGNGAFNWDCDDSDVTVHPAADSICGDGKDNNCDGYVDRLCYSACDGSWPFQQAHSQSGSVRAVDLDGDGNFEITVSHNFGFAVLKTDGSAILDHSEPVHNYARRPPVFADIDTYDIHGAARQSLEILTGNGSFARFYRYDPNSQTLELIENTDVSVYDASQFLAYDIDFDGVPEFATTTWCNEPVAARFFRFDRDTNTIVHVNDIVDTDGKCNYTNERVLTDLDGDGITEFVHGSGYSSQTSPNYWSGHIFAKKFTDITTLETADWCAGGCFNTDIQNLFGARVRSLFRVGNEFRAQVNYFATNTPQEKNVITTRWWRFGLAGNLLEGPTTSSNTIWENVTDINDDGVFDTTSWVRWPGLFDVNGDGFPDRLRHSGSNLLVDLWDDNKKTFIGQSASQLSISNKTIGLEAIWDINGDGRLNVLSRDSIGRVYCHQLGEDTWNKLSSLPPHNTNAYRTGQWDNYEPNDGADTTGDGIPDRISRIPSALTSQGHFYSYLSHPNDEDFHLIDTSWGGNICMRSPKNRVYTMHVYSYFDKWDNTTKAPVKDGKADGLVWENTSNANNKCFYGNKVAPFRHGEYRFVVGIKSKTGDHSAFWPYWIHASK